MAKKGSKNEYPDWFNPKEDYQSLVEIEKSLLSKLDSIDNPSTYIRFVKTLTSLQRIKRSYAKYV